MIVLFMLSQLSLKLAYIDRQIDIVSHTLKRNVIFLLIKEPVRKVLKIKSLHLEQGFGDTQ